MGKLARRLLLLVAAAAAFSLAVTSASAYELDPTFDGDGVVTTNGPGSAADTITDIEVLSDGKILAVGRSSSAGTARDFALLKYNADGSLDTAFGGGDGIVTTDIGGNASGDVANALAVQPGGKIVVAGFTFPFPEASNDEDTAIVRYNADGTLDDDTDMDGGFGGDGIVTVPASSDTDSGIALKVDGSGRTIVAGELFAGDATQFDFFVVRLGGDGALDATFDGPSGTGNGIVTLDFTGGDPASDGALAVDLLDDGDIIAGGYAIDDDSDPEGFALARLNSGDGTLDTAFDGDSLTPGNGVVTTNNSGQVEDLAITPGKILAVGSSGSNGFGLARYNQTNGTLDTTFDGDSGTGNGIVTTSFGPGTINAQASSVAIDGSDYVVAGNVTGAADSDEIVGSARYFGDGTLDSGYGGDGLVTTNRQPAVGSEDGAAVAVIDDGDVNTENKVLVGGRTVPGNDFTQADFALYQYAPDETAPDSEIDKPVHRKTYRASRIRTFRGTAADPSDGSGVDEVEVALRRRRTNGNCSWFDGAAFVPGDCAVKSFEDASPAAKRGAYGDPASWNYELPGKLKPSVDTKFKDYTLYARATDHDANVEAEFEAKRNANRFEVR